MFNPLIKKKKSRMATIYKQPRLAELSNIKEGYAESFDGTRIWYRCVGKGIPIIFCNGLGCSTFFWKSVHSHFSKSHQSIIFDWRGHGRSDKPKHSRNITMNAVTKDLHAVIKHLKLKKFILAGHSMGVQVVLSYYHSFPCKILALLLCCGTFGNPMETFYNTQNSKHVFTLIYVFNHLFPKLANLIGYIISKNPFWFQMGSALKMMNPGLVDKQVIKEYIEHITSVDAIFLAKLAKSMQEYNAESVLKGINIPTLIVAGERDIFTPVWISKKMHHLIPYSELLIVKKASHVALIEQPALINLRIEKFIYERL
ncbi:MAG: alpha/beta hydrolase [Deltaproteobacteria bacterium]|nr:alpha/beta hydrolase [Deltaproteobacteria bacterium]